jgi:signal transduction histidine kinase
MASRVRFRARRHSAAQHVWFELTQSESNRELFVRDDGVGFGVASTQEQAARRGSHVLLGMADRVHFFDCILRVDSELSAAPASMLPSP